MMLPQLDNLIKIDDDITNDNYGHYPDKRSIESLLYYGLVLVDKPAGPTSHEVVAWMKRILEIEKAGHSGTLDPGATGLLPIGLGEGTKALSVRRVTRVRSVYEFDYLENYDRLVLMRILCQAGTYIRKIIYDIGEVVSSGATMVELRRTRVSNLSEQNEGLVRLHDIADAYQRYKERKDEEKLRRLILPIEHCLAGIRAITVRDTAVDALCHGAPLAVPGVIAVPKDLRKGELVGVYTLKGEIVGLAQTAMIKEEIEQNVRGIAFVMKRIIMKPNTYPKAWRSKGEQSNNVSIPSEIDLDKLENENPDEF
jgi:H/ACA ribonucleoprotein complex subunit 4